LTLKLEAGKVIYVEDLLAASTVQKTVASGSGKRRNGFRLELVSVTVTKEDYAKLKATGGPHPDQISMALRYYLDKVNKTSRHLHVSDLGWNRGPVTTFPCALPKSLLDDVRNLEGRFDSHTIEAVKRYIL
jgi:hypothetical protein